MTLNEYTVTEIKKIFDIVKEQRFLMLKGATGTGKTLYAHALACMLVDGDENPFGEPTTQYKDKNGKIYDSVYHKVNIREKFITLLQSGQVRNVVFQKGTSRENFVYGTVAHTENNKMVFRKETQIFLEAVKAAKDDEDHNHVLILDDIGRADFSAVMGDLLSALESMGDGNAFQADEKRQIPPNLYIIATYNHAVAASTVDYAWFRRFFVYEMNADERHIIKSRETIWQNNTIYQMFDENGNMRNDWDAFCNFKTMDPYQKLMDYVYVIFMHVKILFERYCADPDVRNLYIPGHGMFLTYDPQKEYMDNICIFHKQFRHVIVPLLYHCLHTGLLDNRAAFDIELLAHLWDKGYGSISEKKESKGGFRSREDAILKILIKSFPAAVSYFFFLRNPLLRRTDHGNVNSYFLFEKEKECYHYSSSSGNKEDYHLRSDRYNIHISGTNITGSCTIIPYDTLNADTVTDKHSQRNANEKEFEEKFVEDYDGRSGQVYSPLFFLKLIKISIRLLEIKDGAKEQEHCPVELCCCQWRECYEQCKKIEEDTDADLRKNGLSAKERTKKKKEAYNDIRFARLEKLCEMAKAILSATKETTAYSVS